MVEEQLSGSGLRSQEKHVLRSAYHKVAMRTLAKS